MPLTDCWGKADWLAGFSRYCCCFWRCGCSAPCGRRDEFRSYDRRKSCPNGTPSFQRTFFLWTGNPKTGNPSPVLVRLTRWLLLGTLMISIGFHWAILQSVAWAGMLIKYSRSSSSIGVAVTMTFDGRHPCRLCQVARIAQKSDAPENAVPKVPKLDLFVDTCSSALISRTLRSLPVMASDVVLASRQSPPPTPPPRWS